MVLEIYGVIQLHASLHTTSLAPLGWDGAPFPFLFFVRSDALFGQRLTYCWVNLSSTNCGCNCLPSQFPHLVVTSILERGGESMHLADGGHCFTSVQLSKANWTASVFKQLTEVIWANSSKRMSSFLRSILFLSMSLVSKWRACNWDYATRATKYVIKNVHEIRSNKWKKYKFQFCG